MAPKERYRITVECANGHRHDFRLCDSMPGQPQGMTQVACPSDGYTVVNDSALSQAPLYQVVLYQEILVSTQRECGVCGAPLAATLRAIDATPPTETGEGHGEV